MQLLKNKPIRDMKKLFFYCIIAFFITSCASYKYSKKTENTFNLTSNVDQVIVSNKSGSLRSINKSSSYQNHNYEINLDKINNKYLSLQVTKNNYDTAYLKLIKTPRFGAIARDFFIGIPTFFTPFLIDAFRSDFYQISSKSKHQEVKLKHHQEFMKNEFKKIENSASPSDFVDYISNYPHSNFVNQATDKKDASELVIAVNKVSESEIDNYILSHQNSSSLNEAKKIKDEIPESRLAFQEAINLNSFVAYEQFLAKYPKSIEHKEAHIKLTEIAFQEAINLNSASAYEQFLAKYPNSILNKEAHIKLIDAAEKEALSSNNLNQMLAYYDNYLQKLKNFIGEETYKSKNAIISKTIDNQIVLENNPKQLWNYNEYSKLWITYIDVSTKYKNKLLTLDISKAYDLKISSELFALLIKISDANKHAEFLQKASIDFPELSNTKDLILITILQKSSNKNGNLKLFNQAYVPYLISKNKLNNVKSFNYKKKKYQSMEGSNYEELTFTNNEIQEIKVFKDNNLQTQLKFSSGYSNLNEASYFINGQLVLTEVLQFGEKIYPPCFYNKGKLNIFQVTDYEILLSSCDETWWDVHRRGYDEKTWGICEKLGAEYPPGEEWFLPRTDQLEKFDEELNFDNQLKKMSSYSEALWTSNQHKLDLSGLPIEYSNAALEEYNQEQMRGGSLAEVYDINNNEKKTYMVKPKSERFKFALARVKGKDIVEIPSSSILGNLQVLSKITESLISKLGEGWRLPSIEELEFLKKNGKTCESDLSPCYYWSKTPFSKSSTDSYFSFHLPRGSRIESKKYDRMRAIPVKSTDFVPPPVVVASIFVGNLEVMKGEISESSMVEAIEVVKKLGNGWRLPTITELKLIYENKSIIGGDNTFIKIKSQHTLWKVYWSSSNDNKLKYPNTDTEYGFANNYWVMDFGSGRCIEPKSNCCDKYYIRAVR